MQEHDVALPFLDPNRGIEQTRQLGRERGQLVEMGEQCAAAVRFVQMLDRRPRDGEAVESGGAASDFIQDDERAVARLLRMAAVSTISTMKVERPRAMSSAAPTRENSRSTAPILAWRAGTKLPICARMAMSAFWRR